MSKVTFYAEIERENKFVTMSSSAVLLSQNNFSKMRSFSSGATAEGLLAELEDSTIEIRVRACFSFDL